MKVAELAQAMTKMVENGHGDVDVIHVGGTQTRLICGWQLVPEDGARTGVPRPAKQLWLFTTMALRDL